MGNITWHLVTFYSISLFIIFILYKHKLKDWKTSMLFALMTLFVAREYYEIPIFFMGYLGLFNQYFPMVFHHLLVVIVFLVLVSYSRIKWTKSKLTLLLVTPAMLSPLLLGSPNTFTLYLARTIGIAAFGGVFIHGIR